MRKADRSTRRWTGMLDTAEEAVKVILKDGPAAAMNRFNRKERTKRKIAADQTRIHTDQESIGGLSVLIRREFVAEDLEKHE